MRSRGVPRRKEGTVSPERRSNIALRMNAAAKKPSEKPRTSVNAPEKEPARRNVIRRALITRPLWALDMEKNLSSESSRENGRVRRNFQKLPSVAARGKSRKYSKKPRERGVRI